jgi:glycosyltransferase involved in cell wall biosynthesis
MNIFMIHPHDLITAPWTIRIIKFAESFARRGHTVTVAYFPSRERREKGLIVRSSLPPGPRFVELRARKWYLFHNIRQVCELSRDADVIHVQKCFSDAVLPALYSARLHQKPLHYDWDDDESMIARHWEDSSFFSRQEIILYEKAMPRLATTISVASRALQELAYRFGSNHDEHIFSAPVGADLSEFDALKGAPCSAYPDRKDILRWVLYVGQLEGANYASILIKAFAEIARMRPGIGMLIAGGGFGQAGLQREILELNLQERAFITGYLPHQEIPAIMARADVAVACLEDTPNARAKSPLKVVEYLAAGRAVVGSAVGEVVRMLDGCGVLVPPADVGALRDAVLRLLDDPDQRRELGKKARAQVEKIYNWENSADNIMLAYEKGIQLMKGRG